MLAALWIAGALLAGDDPSASPFDLDVVVAAALDGGVQRDAAWLIATIEEVDRTHGREAAVDTLHELLRHDHLPAELQVAIAHCVGKLGSDARAVVPRLLSLARDWDYAEVRGETPNAVLSRLGIGQLPELVADAGVRDREWDTFWAAGSWLRSFGPDAVTAVPSLTAALAEDDLPIRWRAACLLGDLGPAGEEAVPVLLALLSVDALERELGDDGLTLDDLRGAAAGALGDIGARPEEVVPALIDALRDGSADLRNDAGLALGRMGAAAKAAVPDLVAALAVEPASDCPRFGCLNCGIAPDHWAATALVNIGADSIPALTEALQSERASVRRHAADALWYFQDAARDSAPNLIALLRDPEPAVREKAVHALGYIGADAAAAVPAVSPLLGDEAAIVRTNVARTLERFGAGASQAVPLLRVARHDRDPMVRSAVLQALAAIDGEGATAMLVQALQDPEADVQRAAAHELRDLPASSAAVAGLIQALSDHDEDVRFAVIVALSHFGPAASAAKPALIELQRRGGGSLQDEIYRALKRIAGGEP